MTANSDYLGSHTFHAGHHRRPCDTSWTAQATTTSSLDLFYNYPSNVALYDKWHEYFRKHQPRMLILWGQNDPFFTVAG